MPTSGAATTGLGTAAQVHVSGTNVTNCSGGTGTNYGTNGQGRGAAPSTNFPVAQYALTLSLSAASPYLSSETLTAALVDVANAAYSPAGTVVWKSYGAPQNSGTPSWYQPNNGTAGPNTYNACVATVVTSGQLTATITAIAKGQVIVEAQFPVFDNTLGNNGGSFTDPVMMVFAQIVVTVIT